MIVQPRRVNLVGYGSFVQGKPRLEALRKGAVPWGFRIPPPPNDSSSLGRGEAQLPADLSRPCIPISAYFFLAPEGQPITLYMSEGQPSCGPCVFCQGMLGL